MLLCACFGRTQTKIGTIQRRSAWPLHRDGTQTDKAFHIKKKCYRSLIFIYEYISKSSSHHTVYSKHRVFMCPQVCYEDML